VKALKILRVKNKKSPNPPKGEKMLEVFPHLEVEVFPLGKTTGTSGTSGAFFRRKKFAKLPAELHYVEILRCAEFVSSRRADCSTELSKLRISEEASHDVYAVRQPSCSPELAISPSPFGA